MNIVFAAISPHPPLLLSSTGSEEDRLQVKKTINSLESLNKKFKKARPDIIIISSPHPDWGFNVPLFFLARRSLGKGGLAKDFKGKIKSYLTDLEDPEFYFEKGKKIYKELSSTSLSSSLSDLGVEDRASKKYALIASGDLSHCLKQDGPYGFHPDGPKFDKALIEYLKKKDIGNILKLNQQFPNAEECGLRSFCFILGILQASKLNWQPEILSYENPFGVGYLVADFKLITKNRMEYI